MSYCNMYIYKHKMETLFSRSFDFENKVAGVNEVNIIESYNNRVTWPLTSFKIIVDPTTTTWEIEAVVHSESTPDLFTINKSRLDSKDFSINMASGGQEYVKVEFIIICPPNSIVHFFTQNKFNVNIESAAQIVSEPPLYINKGDVYEIMYHKNTIFC